MERDGGLSPAATPWRGAVGPAPSPGGQSTQLDSAGCSRQGRSPASGSAQRRRGRRGGVSRRSMEARRGETGAAWLDAQHDSPARSNAEGDARIDLVDRRVKISAIDLCNLL